MSAMPMPDADACQCVTRAAKRLTALMTQRVRWETTWRDIDRYVMPGRYHDPLKQTTYRDGTRDDQGMYTSDPEDACDAARSGLAGGMASPARMWFRYGLRDPDMLEQADVKAYLYAVEQTQAEMFQKTNTYDALSVVFLDWCVFGTACAILEPDPKEVFRLSVCDPGSYYLTLDDRKRVNGAFHACVMTAAQMYEAFGNCCSEQVCREAKCEQEDTQHTVIQAIQPRDRFDASSDAADEMPWESVWWEYGKHSGPSCCLRESGYEYFPVLAPRWDIRSNGAYGYGRGHKALPSARQLHAAHELRMQGVEWLANPALLLPPTLDDQGPLMPGKRYFVPLSELGAQARSAYDMHPQGVVAIGEVINKLTEDVRRAMLNHLFLMISEGVQRQTTAQEIIARTQEKVNVLGPYLERGHSELLRPLLDITYQLLNRAFMLPEPPPSLQGQDMPPEFISSLAQAQKLTAVAPMFDFVNVLGQAASLDPGVLDKFNGDEFADQAGIGLNVPPRVIRSDEEADAIRQQKQRAHQAQQMAEIANQGSAAAKNLGQTPMTGDTALTRALQIAGVQ